MGRQLRRYGGSHRVIRSVMISIGTSDREGETLLPPLPHKSVFARRRLFAPFQPTVTACALSEPLNRRTSQPRPEASGWQAVTSTAALDNNKGICASG